MNDSTLQTVDRALMVLELLAKEGLTATEIQKQLDLNKSTVHRLMMTLLNRGFVERNEQTGIYQVGIRLVEISSMRLNHIELRTEATPYLHQLAEQVGHSVQLAILDDDEAVFIEKVEMYRSYHMFCQIGKRIPLYCSAVGKSLLLHQKDETILTRLKRQTFHAFTKNTHQAPEAVLKDIHLGRKQGYTTDQAEHEAGIYCIAMPIYDYRGQVVAAASLTALENIFLTDSAADKRKALLNTCLTISKRLGYQLKQ